MARHVAHRVDTEQARRWNYGKSEFLNRQLITF